MQTLLRGLPVYVADIDDDDCGIKRISLVDSPAVERDFLAFSADKITAAYSVADEERRHVLGVVMRANYPIYRKDPTGEEYFIMYRRDAIERMAERYLKEGRANFVNIQHVDGSDVDGVDLVQWFIKDTAKGVTPAGFEDIEDGSLFAEFHVNNDDVWRDIKAGTFKGFSLEGVFSITPSTSIPSEEKMPRPLLDWLGKLSKQITLKEMGVLEKIREALATLAEVKLGSATTQQGVIYWDGDEELKVGDAVFVNNESDERVAAPDGDYTFEDGHVVKVAEGKVTEIGEVPEPAPEGEEMRQNFAKANEAIAAAYSMSYNEKEKKIYEAIRANGFDGWIVEAGDDFAVLHIWDGNEEKYWRFGVTWEGEQASVSEPVEVFPSFVTAEDIARLDEGARHVEDMRRNYESVKAELEELKSKSSAAPAHEEFNNQTTHAPARTISQEMSRLSAIGEALKKK